jgi:hypothetical protein
MRKAGLAVVVLALLGWLFWRSVQSTLAEPYAVDSALVSEWMLALRAPDLPGPGFVVLQPPDQLRADLFNQIFNRTMESMTSPTVAAMPLLLHAEYRQSVAVLTPDEVLQVAEEAGLRDTVPAPVCIGVVRRPGAGSTRQLYYARFEAPAVDRFRNALARRQGAAGGAPPFEPGEFPSIVPLAASDADFASWWPLDPAEVDCLAPLVVE